MKKISTKLISVVFALLAIGFVSETTFAACTSSGKVMKVYSNTSGSSNYSYFYITKLTGVIPTFAYYVRADSADSHGAATLTAASNSGDTVLVQGNASRCPVSGTFRFMGTLNYVHKYVGR